MLYKVVRGLWHLIPQKIRYGFIALLQKMKNAILRLKATQYAKKMKKLKNSAYGKRCFIIGNGPSLTVDDLEKLKSEDCFATNRIYRLFDQTKWRPRYYCSQDEVLINNMQGEFESIISQCESVLLSATAMKQRLKGEKLYYFYVDCGPFQDDMPPFSEDITKQIYEGYTVLYACIQIAVYMGYKEIYLLGVDHNYIKNKKGNYDGNRSYAKGLEVDLTNLNPPRLDNSQKAYEVAEKYCREKGIEIKNATRGGQLEVFERVDLDDILKNNW